VKLLLPYYNGEFSRKIRFSVKKRTTLKHHLMSHVIVMTSWYWTYRINCNHV